MTIARKPKAAVPSKNTSAPKDEAAIMRVIDQGGSSAKPNAQAGQRSKVYQHPLKFPHNGEIWQRLEAARNSEGIKPPRNTWILQAIFEKLEREGH